MPIASSVAKCGRASLMLSSRAAVSVVGGNRRNKERHGGWLSADCTWAQGVRTRRTDVTFCDDENVRLGGEGIQDSRVVLRRNRERGKGRPNLAAW